MRPDSQRKSRQPSIMRTLFPATLYGPPRCRLKGAQKCSLDTPNGVGWIGGGTCQRGSRKGWIEDLMCVSLLGSRFPSPNSR